MTWYVPRRYLYGLRTMDYGPWTLEVPQVGRVPGHRGSLTGSPPEQL